MFKKAEVLASNLPDLGSQAWVKVTDHTELLFSLSLKEEEDAVTDTARASPQGLSDWKVPDTEIRKSRCRIPARV